MMFAPLEGWRHVKVTERNAAVDYAHVLKEKADLDFANAKTIVLVQDNLTIHSKDLWSCASYRGDHRICKSISTASEKTISDFGQARGARQRRLLREAVGIGNGGAREKSIARGRPT
jgi:hypothetical protein